MRFLKKHRLICTGIPSPKIRFGYCSESQRLETWKWHGMEYGVAFLKLTTKIHVVKNKVAEI